MSKYLHYPIKAELIGTGMCRTRDAVYGYGRTPVLALCRKLMAAGIDPDAALEVYRRAVLALRVRSIREGARLDVDERRGAPWFVRYRSPADKGLETRPHSAEDGDVPAPAMEAAE
jgi:Fe2+ transport system protein FeoA